jgi:crotonobetainyl-CoA:carnitine CoA-transferase CaiB-like acyl-CoA transferase
MTAPAAPPTGSLQGLRVVEIGTSVAAPMAGQILGDLGADVVKVERVGQGDDSRSWAPPHWDDESVTFLALNRNKKSLALDYKDPRGRKVLEDLVKSADVVLHNLRPGALAAAGFAAADLHRLNPRLINIEMTGFGPVGPRAGQPGYDPLLQAYSGIVSITGQDSGPPSRVPVSLLDMGTGMWAVLAVYEALRRRDATGQGCHVQLSLLQTALTWLSMPLLTVLAGNPPPPRLGSGLPGIVPYGAYPTRDGYVFMSAGNDVAWARLCEALDAGHLRDKEGFCTNGERVRARSLVEAELGAVTGGFTTAEVLSRLGAAGVPCAPVQTLTEVVADEQVAAIGAISPLAHERVAGFSVVNLPVTFDGSYLPHRNAPPALGADTAAVLADLGRSPAEIAELVRDHIADVAPEPASQPAVTP